MKLVIELLDLSDAKHGAPLVLEVDVRSAGEGMVLLHVSPVTHTALLQEGHNQLIQDVQKNRQNQVTMSLWSVLYQNDTREAEAEKRV